MIGWFALLVVAAIYYVPWLKRVIGGFLYQYPYVQKLPGLIISVLISYFCGIIMHGLVHTKSEYVKLKWEMIQDRRDFRSSAPSWISLAIRQVSKQLSRWSSMETPWLGQRTRLFSMNRIISNYFSSPQVLDPRSGKGSCWGPWNIHYDCTGKNNHFPHKWRHTQGTVKWI